ncbi:MAG: RagB/SusD family nutrient uptake outer membrane protein [Bacteroidales bacterium]
MKNLYKVLLLSGLLVGSVSCSDFLDTNPTDKTSGTTIFKDARNAEVAMNGIYRATYVSGWSVGNEHQNFGIQSSTMVAELMGDDYVQAEQGNGWFYFDYIYNSRTRWTFKSWRSYAQWNFYYTLISNCNYIIAEEGKISGDEKLANSVVAQAYAMRGYCYFQLAQQFAQTLVGHEDWKGVPIYTEPTTAQSVGKPRATVQEVYNQINSDLEKALALFQTSGLLKQKHASHIDWYVTNGFKAQVALVEQNWAKAIEASTNALSVPGKTVMLPADLSKGFNAVTLPSTMWGANIIADQSTVYASYFSHMDSSDPDKYAAKSRKCVSSWLYSKVAVNDARKTWWKDPATTTDESSGMNKKYNQTKFRFYDMTQSLGDYIYMRLEEMVLIKAEAECHAGQYDNAIATLKTLMAKRLPAADQANYSSYLSNLTKSGNVTFTQGTYGDVSTLMDEIILQRRIELWGEGRRLYDIIRLKTGFTRNFPETNHSNKLESIDTATPDSKYFIFPLPQSEFDGNPSISLETDQNPV